MSAPPASEPRLSLVATWASLPPLWPESRLPAIQAALAAGAPKLVVLDDDPTGTQTVYDVPTLTTWATWCPTAPCTAMA